MQGPATDCADFLCPEGAASYAAWRQALADGRVEPEEEAVRFDCATGLKHPKPETTRTLDRHARIDFSRFRG